MAVVGVIVLLGSINVHLTLFETTVVFVRVSHCVHPNLAKDGGGGRNHHPLCRKIAISLEPNSLAYHTILLFECLKVAEMYWTFHIRELIKHV